PRKLLEQFQPKPGDTGQSDSVDDRQNGSVASLSTTRHSDSTGQLDQLTNKPRAHFRRGHSNNLLGSSLTFDRRAGSRTEIRQLPNLRGDVVANCQAAWTFLGQSLASRPRQRCSHFGFAIGVRNRRPNFVERFAAVTAVVQESLPQAIHHGPTRF